MKISRIYMENLPVHENSSKKLNLSENLHENWLKNPNCRNLRYMKTVEKSMIKTVEQAGYSKESMSRSVSPKKARKKKKKRGRIAFGLCLKYFGDFDTFILPVSGGFDFALKPVDYYPVVDLDYE